MNFQDLHELLRLELLRRIDQGELTGTRLAQQAGFRQAHISNFLNRKRSLSLEGLDRVMAAQGLTIDQILPLGITAIADRPPPETAVRQTLQDAAEIVPVVTLSAAAIETEIQPGSVIESLHVSTPLLSGNRTRLARRPANWQRFVAIRPNAQEISAMHPVLPAGAVTIIDRHYNSIAPYRADQPTLLAIRYGSGLMLRFVELDGGRLILRPAAADHPLHFVTVAATETASDFIVGRVCLIVQEL